MSQTNDDADLAPSVASGYKITEKKTLDEYTALDSKYFLLDTNSKSNPVLVTSPLKSGKQVLVSQTKSSLPTPMIREGYTLFIVVANTR